MQEAVNAPADAPSAGQDDSQTAKPTPRSESAEVIRLQLDEFGNPLALQTATKTFALKNDKGEVELEVFLESVIHLADTSYYRGFQQRFEHYDAVLYELVAEQPRPPSTDDEMPSGFQLFRQISTGAMGLTYQLEAIDYSSPNMIHADLSPSEIAERMANRGETKMTLLVDLIAHAAKTAGAEKDTADVAPEAQSLTNEAANGNGFDLSLLTDPDGIMKIRRLLAKNLVNSQLLESSFPPSIHRLLIGDRNDRVMTALNEERTKGKRRIAIFYGAGHMPDFERRLVNEYGMELVDVNWRSAWDLRDGAIAGGPLEGLIESTFRDSIKEKLSQLAKRRQREPEAEETPEAGVDDEISDKDAKIKALEDTLKELESKLEKLENQSPQPDEKSPDGGDSKPKKSDRKNGKLIV
jgi:hypothetical protein